MKAKNLNASSVKTRNLIRDTFAELLYEKENINKITVTELVQRADINRSTFYSHYDDVRHVAEDIKAETLKAFFENKTISNVHDIEPFFDEIYAYIKKNDSFFRLIFISDEVTNFVRHLGNICKGRIYEAVNKDDSIRDKHLLELEVSAFSDGIAMQFIRYYHNDYSGDGFIVMKGSGFSPSETKSCQTWIKSLRAQLVADGKVKDCVFMEDIYFKSTSAAAACVTGGSANGNIMWLYSDGQSIKDKTANI